MAGEWRECRIGEIADVVGGSTPPTKDPSNFNGDIPWLTPKDLAGSHDRYISRGERNLSRKGLERCSAKLLPPGTVLVTSRAPIGYVAIAKNPIATNQGFRSLIPKPGIDSEFLYYWIKANVEELRRHASGSTFQELTGSAFAQLRIRVPPLPEQRAIAHILGTLDDKIELNRRMSETLEQMARALFKSWFVDFDPVRAKMEGRWKRHSPLPANEGPVERSTPLPLGEGKGEGKKHLPSDLLDFARELRKTATDAERLLWRLLRNRALEGAKFRRQHPVPPYVLDFYCHELKLAIEVDGGQHNEPPRKKRDEERTAFLESHGIRVLRFWNREVLHETEGVLEAIYQAIVERRQEVLPSPPTPLPEGEGGYLPAHLYDLFPDRLVDSELGEIPEGWMIDKIGEHVRCVKGKSYKSADLQDSDTALVTLKSFARGGGYRPDGLKSYTGDFKPEQVVLPGELVIACTDVTQAAEVIGKPALVQSCNRYKTLVASLDVLIVRPTTEAVSVPFLYCLFRSDDFAEHTYAHSTGTTVLHLSKDAVPSYQFARPPVPLVQMFTSTAEAIFKRIDEAAHESRTLAALRDALLPKLISGELRVKDAERFVARIGT